MKKHTALYISLISTFLMSCHNPGEHKIKEPQTAISHERRDTIWNTDKQLQSVVFYKNNELSTVIFYDKGRKVKRFNYITIENKSVPNEFYKFGFAGDTLKNESLYRVIRCVKDTISADEKYKFQITLEGHLLPDAYLSLADVNDDYPIYTDKKMEEVVEMKEFKSTGLSTKGKTKGWNYIRGRIDNVQEGSANNKVRTEVINVYFVDSFYVK